MFYSPVASLDEAIGALTNGQRSMLVTGPKGSVLVSSRNMTPQHSVGSPMSGRNVWLVGVSSDFHVKMQRQQQFAFDAPDAALLFAQRLAITGYAHASAITIADRQDGITGKMVTL